MKKYIGVITLLLMGSVNVFAHAIFIDTEEIGEINKPHAVTVFYAEPSSPKKELIKDWWSNTEDFSLWLIDPAGNKEKLAVEMKKDFFTTVFIPSHNGTYRLIIQQVAEDIAGGTQYEFNTSAIVTVGKEHTANPLISGLTLFKNSKETTSLNTSTSVLLQDDNQPLADTDITIFSSSGWEKTIKTDANGVAVFSPEWKGVYLIEAHKVEKVSDKEYKKKYRIISTSITCK